MSSTSELPASEQQPPAAPTETASLTLSRRPSYNTMQQPTASTSALPPPTTTPSASSIHLRKRPQSSKPIKPWYKIQLAYELENKGSVARDHLASERTYLAWLRTSLSLASIGIAITQLFRLSSSPSTTDPSTPTPTAVSALVQEWSANPDIAALQKLLVETTKRLDALNVVQSLATTGGDTQTNPGKYRHLGKPVVRPLVCQSLSRFVDERPWGT